MDKPGHISDPNARSRPPLPAEIEELARSLDDRYLIEREIGRGGMATVYLARDKRHDRKVALKVLNADLGAVLGVERFVAEIRVTANLQHPNLLPLFDSGGAEGKLFYVMPYVDGESLRARLNREKQLPIDEALHIAVAVASALDYAHKHGVVHRDLKPENILLQGGQPVVADFGIALAVSNAGGARVTQTGISLGTPQYMSPEQATGDRTIDGRSDIYSLAAVTYEMLTGEAPHTGSTSQSIIAKLLTDEVRPLTMLRRSVPEHVDAAVRHGLEKLPADRFATANEFAYALGGGASRGVTGTSGFTTPVIARRGNRKRLAAVGAAAFAAGAMLAAASLWPRNVQTTRERHLNIVLPDSLPVAVTGPAPLGIWQKSIAISGDGSTLAYVARTRGVNRLAIRQMDASQVAVVAGSEGAYSPFFSPDGKWVAFFTGTELRKVAVDGGPAVALAANLNLPVGGVWLDNRIGVTRLEGSFIDWYSLSGGAAFRSDSLSDGGVNHLHPTVLPGNATLLAHQVAGVRLITFDPVRAQPFSARDAGSDSASTSQLVGHTVSFSRTGHLVFATHGDGDLMALPFDARALKARGQSVLVLSGVRKELSYETAQYALAGDGTLAWIAGRNENIGHLALLDPRTGKVDTLPHSPAMFRSVRLSADGERVYARVLDRTGATRHLALDLRTARTEEFSLPLLRSSSILRVFGDGMAVVYGAGASHTSVVSLATGDVLRTIPGQSFWLDVSPQREFVAYSRGGNKGYELNVQRLVGDTTPMQFPEPADMPRFSPDGKWLAFKRDVNGTIAVSPVPPDGTIRQVSLLPAEQPLWSASGDKLYFRYGRQMWVADISTSNGFKASVPRQIADAPLIRVRGWSYDVTKDGRLLVVLGSPDESVGHINVITGFDERLRRLAPSR